MKTGGATAFAHFHQQYFAAHLFRGERVEPGGGVVRERNLDHRSMAEIRRDGFLNAQRRLAGFERCSAGLERELQTIGIGRDGLERGGLKVTVVTHRFQTGAAELGGDVLGGNIQARRTVGAALQGVGGQKGNVGRQVVGLQARGDALGGRRRLGQRA